MKPSRKLRLVRYLVDQNVQQGRGLIIKEELTRSQPAVEVRTGVEISADDGASSAARGDQVLAGFVNEYLPLGHHAGEARHRAEVHRRQSLLGSVSTGKSEATNSRRRRRRKARGKWRPGGPGRPPKAIAEKMARKKAMVTPPVQKAKTVRRRRKRRRGPGRPQGSKKKAA